MQLIDQMWENDQDTVNEIEDICELAQKGDVYVEDCFLAAARNGRDTLMEFFLSDKRVERISDEIFDEALAIALKNNDVETVDVLIASGRIVAGDLGVARAIARKAGSTDVVQSLDQTLREYLRLWGAPLPVAIVAFMYYLRAGHVFDARASMVSSH